MKKRTIRKKQKKRKCQCSTKRTTISYEELLLHILRKKIQM